MESYHTKKGDIARHFKEGESVVEWSFNDQLIFARLKSYLSRLHIVEVSPSIGLGRLVTCMPCLKAWCHYVVTMLSQAFTDCLKESCLKVVTMVVTEVVTKL